MRKFRSRHRKVKRNPPYYWLFWYHGLSVTPGDSKRSKSLDGEPPYRMAWYSKRLRGKRVGSAGWDVDRHRFFVSTFPSRYPNTPKRSKFRRLNWERNHGYGPRELQKLHISSWKTNAK